MNKIIVFLLLASTTVLSVAQQVAPLPKEAEKIRVLVQSLPMGGHVTVFPVRGGEEFGDLISNDQDGFKFRDVDQKADVTLRYVDVRKIRKGYGGYNSVRGRHTDSFRAYVVVGAVVVALGVLIGAAAATKN